MKKRKVYLDVLRAIACCMVVGVHVSAQQITLLGTQSISFKFMNAMDCLCIIGVPLFVMISGALMLNPSHDSSIKNLYRHHILHLATAYIAWLLFYNIVDYIKANAAFSWETFKAEVLIDTLLGKGMYHMWFLPMILGLYVLTPVIKQMITSRKLCEYFLVLYFIFNLFYATIFKFSVPYTEIVDSLFSRLPMKMLEGYIGYYVLGYYLDTYFTSIRKRSFYAILMLGVTNFLWEVTVCNRESATSGELSTILNDPLTVNVFFAALAIFLLLRQLFKNINTEGFFYRICRGLGRYSFGVYLIHPLFLTWLTEHQITTLLLPVPISIPLMILLVVSVSYVFVWILSRIPIIGKYIV